MTPSERPPDLDLDEPDPQVLAMLETMERRPLRRVLWIVGGIALIGLISWAVWPSASRRISYESDTVVRGDLVLQVTAVGKLAPMDSVEVGSNLSGRVLSIEVEANARVTADQVLARLDPAPFQNNIAQAEAQMASARAAITQAEVNLASARRDAAGLERLVAQGAATRQALDAATQARDVAIASVASAQAQLAQARTTLERARDDLTESVITSPIDGVVTQRFVDPGQSVVSAMQTTPLFEVASDLADMKAEVGVDEADVGVVAAGQPATFTVSAWPERTFQAEVAVVDLAPEPGQAVVTYDAELRLRNDDLALRPGMTATAAIEVGRLHDALLVPAQALRFTPSREVPAADTALWVLEDGRPVALPVVVEGRDGTRVAVHGEGIQEGLSILVGETER